MTQYYIQNGICGVETAFKIIGSKWCSQIIYICQYDPESTFSDMKKQLQGITDTTLTRQINSLVKNDMIKKCASSVGKQTYSITEKTSDILPALRSMHTFAYKCNYSNTDTYSVISYTKKVIGEKWKSRIIWMLYQNDIMRFNSLKNSIEGISFKILTEQLNDLIDNKLVRKVDYEEKSPKTEYSLTLLGTDAYHIIQALADWCLKYELIKPRINIAY